PPPPPLYTLTLHDALPILQPGDTLSKIAARWREGTDQRISETSQWLFENNSHAFANNNINRLLAGAVLQMPDLSAYRAEPDSAVDRKSTRLNSSHVKISYA